MIKLSYPGLGVFTLSEFSVQSDDSLRIPVKMRTGPYVNSCFLCSLSLFPSLSHKTVFCFHFVFGE